MLQVLNNKLWCVCVMCVCVICVCVCLIVYFFVLSEQNNVHFLSLSPIPVTSSYLSRSNYLNNIFATVKTIKFSSQYIFYPQFYFQQFFLKCCSVLCTLSTFKCYIFVQSDLKHFEHGGSYVIKIIRNIDGLNCNFNFNNRNKYFTYPDVGDSWAG